jgi:outer membrane protein assembly factor BamB
VISARAEFDALRERYIADAIAIRAAGRDQIVTAASPWVIAYDPQDGKEIWRADCLRGEIGASPTFAAGKFFCKITGLG